MWVGGSGEEAPMSEKAFGEAKRRGGWLEERVKEGIFTALLCLKSEFGAFLGSLILKRNPFGRDLNYVASPQRKCGSQLSGGASQT